MIKRHGPTPIMHRAVRHGETFYLGGVAAEDRSADIRGQTTQILNRIGKLLTEIGSDKSRILSATVYITDMAMKTDMNSAWTAWFAAEEMPARATIGVADLGPGILLEVVVTASAR